VPELPEVETARRGIAPLLCGATLEQVDLREPRLRWPVVLPAGLIGQTLTNVSRRGKYLLFEFQTGTLIVHLGMSGSLRVLARTDPYLKHDHIGLLFSNGASLRLNDPRRFGSVHWQEGDAATHWLLARLGIEPLSPAFTGEFLKINARRRRLAVKNLLMDSRVVVGVGNIYANEALFLARVRPTVRANRVTRVAYNRIAGAVVGVLRQAIAMGGTTLRDFVRPDGEPGYFKQSLNVYGRAGEPCVVCETVLTGCRVGQRATFFCKNCQKRQSFA
jgi:formamidopyrimidine-DNA glycosylase